MRNNPEHGARQESLEAIATELRQQYTVAGVQAYFLESYLRNPDEINQITADLQLLSPDISRSTDFTKLIRLIEARQRALDKMLRDLNFTQQLDTAEGAAELYILMFKQKPEKPVRVQRRGLVLNFILRPEDYRALFGPSSDSSGGIYVPTHLREIFSYSAKFSKKYYGLLTFCKDSSRRPTDIDDTETTAIHEETHALFDLLVSADKKSCNYQPSTPETAKIAALNNELQHNVRRDNLEAKANKIHQFWNEYIATNLDAVKNEIFAYFRGDARSRLTSLFVSGKSDQEPFYNYFIGTILFVVGKIDADQLADFKTITETYFKIEYRRIIDQAIAALKKFLRLRNDTIERAIIFFINIPLTEWSKTVADLEIALSQDTFVTSGTDA